MATQVRETTSAEDGFFISGFVEAARVAGESWAASWTATSLSDEFRLARTFIAENGSKRIGFILARPPGAAWEITLTAVSTQSRGAGVFAQMLHALLEVVGRDASSCEIHLEVRADSRAAISAYESSGFKAVGRRRAYYSDGVDAILYTRN